ncbi:ankyrin repeat-containing protein [Quercus suber]|uniref:Ankyrin repeat-containing protein n=1 Tax=Quercus suber TaxID=58331 RepID=A0AAW0IVY4_QUESU
MKSPNAMLEADEFGWIPLHYAAHFGHVEVVKLFLKENISLAYIGDRERMTTLHISAKEGHHVVIKTLIAECPDTCELLDNKYRTAVHYLINEQDKDGNTPFHLAAMKGHCELLIMLAYKYNRRIAWMALNKDGLSTVGIIQSVNKRLMSKEKTYFVSFLSNPFMDSDFIERLQSFMSLIAKEGEVIKAAKNLLRSLWKLGQDLKITDVGEGLL